MTLAEKRAKLIEFLRSNAEISIEVEPEIEGPEGCFDSGDDDFDAETCAKIRAEAEWNVWAWCCVKVTAEYKTWEASDYLGGCNYASEADFKADGYFESMVDQALERLADDIIKADEDLQKLTATIH